MRGGTSKGAYFLADDLPADPRSATTCCCGSWARPTRARSTASAAPIRSPARSRSSAVATADADVDYLFAPGLRRRADRHRPAELRQHPRRRRPVRDRARARRADRARRRVGSDLHGQHRQPDRLGADARPDVPEYAGDARDRRRAGHSGADPARLPGRGGRSVRLAAADRQRAVDEVAGVEHPHRQRHAGVVVLRRPMSAWAGPATSRATSSMRRTWS